MTTPVSAERLAELHKLYADDAERFPDWPMPSEVAAALRELAALRSRLDEAERLLIYVVKYSQAASLLPGGWVEDTNEFLKAGNAGKESKT